MVAGKVGGGRPLSRAKDVINRPETRRGRHGWAYLELEDLYGRADLKPPFNAIAMMTDAATPYEPYISLDGIHPNAAGHHILATAAAAALQAQYAGMVP